MPYVIFDHCHFLHSEHIFQGASDKEVRRAYRNLAVVWHPDKGGDHKKFMRITRAYKAYVSILFYHLLFQHEMLI